MSFERRKVRVGRVASNVMDRTVVVVVEWRRSHPLYKKSVKRRTRFMAHDAQNECRIGDLVRIIETRPISKTKRWRVTEIMGREDIAELQPEEIMIEDTQVPEPVVEAAAVAEEAEAAIDELVEVETATAEEETEEAVEEEPVAEVEEAVAEEEPEEAVEEGPEAEDEATEVEEPVAEVEEAVAEEEPEEAVEEGPEAEDEATEVEEPVAEAEEAVAEEEPEEAVEEEPEAEVDGEEGEEETNLR